MIDEISSIFSEIGFSVAEGPDVETEYNNFTALNTPEDHPARDMHDTFYLDNDKKILLRTHTSPVQVRTMLNGKPHLKLLFLEELIVVIVIKPMHQCSISLRAYI